MTVTGDSPPSDDERAQIVQRLTEHVSTGHLTLGEFDERVQRVYAAISSADLGLATRDLPALPSAASSRQPPPRWLVSVFGGSTVTGRWRLGRRLRCVALFGGDDVDFRNAVLDDDAPRITAIAVFGGHDLYLPAGLDVRVTGFALFGGNEVHGGQEAVAPGGPVVNVRVFSLFGGTDVWYVPPDAANLSLRKVKRRIKKRT
ncbi:MAG: DUF1707 SHOCT-like domain-containing protein [Pseudonocardiaceae bacterium]